MQLPVALREAMSRQLEGVSRKALAERAERISAHYRSGGVSALAIRDDLDALAYAIARMPATYGAVWNALGRLEERCPGFTPRRVLDPGSGPGTASWAAAATWPSIDSIAQVDSNPHLLRLGKILAESSSSPALQRLRQTNGDIVKASTADSPADLVILSYALAELDNSAMSRALASAWQQCAGALVLVEPGTPEGYRRILAAREALSAQNARIAAPCPHERACPLAPGDWCHFVQRVARSRDHMILKSAEVPFEDEKFSYLVAVRENLFAPAVNDRILARPQLDRRGFTAKLCKTDGNAAFVTIPSRDKDAFKRAKKLDWGDEI